MKLSDDEDEDVGEGENEKDVILNQIFDDDGSDEEAVARASAAKASKMAEELAQKEIDDLEASGDESGLSI